MMHVGLLVGGLVMLALWVALLRNPQYWGGSDTQERFVAAGLPLLGSALMLGYLSPALGDVVGGFAVLLAVALTCAALLWGMFGLPLPQWSMPARIRDERAARTTAEAVRKRAKSQARRGGRNRG
jgi:hypothetical protein